LGGRGAEPAGQGRVRAMATGGGTSRRGTRCRRGLHRHPSGEYPGAESVGSLRVQAGGGVRDGPSPPGVGAGPAGPVSLRMTKAGRLILRKWSLPRYSPKTPRAVICAPANRAIIDARVVNPATSVRPVKKRNRTTARRTKPKRPVRKPSKVTSLRGRML